MSIEPPTTGESQTKNVPKDDEKPNTEGKPRVDAKEDLKSGAKPTSKDDLKAIPMADLQVKLQSTWDSAEADALLTQACGQDRWRDNRPLTDDIRRLTNNELWHMRTKARKTLLIQMRDRYTRQLSAEDASHVDVAQILKEEVLTVGFARRFATYKRSDLLLHDPGRLIHLPTNSRRPLQLLLAGKAHPEDVPGQALIKHWDDFIKRPEVRGHVVFLSDYHMQRTAGEDLSYGRRPCQCPRQSAAEARAADCGPCLRRCRGWRPG